MFEEIGSITEWIIGHLPPGCCGVLSSVVSSGAGILLFQMRFPPPLLELELVLQRIKSLL